MNVRYLLGLVLTVSMLVNPDFAQSQSTSAEAEQLFRDGKALMKKGKFAEACAAFETSYKLDPALSTRLNLADCREKNGQLATAWGLFLEAEHETRGNAKQAPLNKTAKERAAALETRLSYLTVSVPDESRVQGLVILRNGDALDEGLWNRAVPVDGGQIVVSASAPGHEAWSTTITLPEASGKVSVEVPKFKEIVSMVKEPEPIAEPSTIEPADDGVATNMVGPMSEPSILTGRRKVAVGVATAGVVTLGVGTWLGLSAKGLDKDALDLCPDPDVPCAHSDDATSLSSRASSRALLANVAFGAGAAVAGTAVYLWITGTPDSTGGVTAIAPQVGADYAGLAFEGSF